MKHETIITCEIGTIEQTAASISKMILVKINGGGVVHTYSDYSINGLYSDYKNILANLAADESNRPNGRKRYS